MLVSQKYVDGLKVKLFKRKLGTTEDALCNSGAIPASLSAFGHTGVIYKQVALEGEEGGRAVLFDLRSSDVLQWNQKGLNKVTRRFSFGHHSGSYNLVHF